MSHYIQELQQTLVPIALRLNCSQAFKGNTYLQQIQARELAKSRDGHINGNLNGGPAQAEKEPNDVDMELI